MKTLKIYLLFSLFLNLSLHAQNERVGIGTTNPQAKLHIAGDLQVEDLAGNGERTLVATPEGKIKAITDATTPTPSNTDTLRAKFIELVNNDGDTKFIINAHTGQFQMMDNDTVWYRLEVNSPPSILERVTKAGGRFISSNKEDVDAIVAEGISRIEPRVSLFNNGEEALDLLQNGTVTKVDIDATSFRDNLTPDGVIFKQRFLITNSEGDKQVVILKLNHILDPVLHTIQVIGKKPSKSQIAKEEDGVEATEDTNIESFTTTVSDEEGEVISQSTEGIDEESKPIETLTDFFQFLNNQKTSDESTLSNTQTGDNISIQIDEENGPNVRFTLGGSTVIINEQEIKQTNESGTEKATQISKILQDVSGFKNLLQEQGNQGGIITETQISVATEATEDEEQDEQIDDNQEDLDKEEAADEEQDEQIADNEENFDAEIPTEDAQDAGIEADKILLEQLKEDLENFVDGEDNGPTSSFLSFDGSDFANLRPTSLLFKPVSEDGSKGEFTKDEIKFVDANGNTFLIDCETIQKAKQSKATGLVAMGLNLDEETLEIVGDLDVLGSITEIGKKIIQIDHPDDSNNQSLQYSPVGTNELLNIYSGNTTTNKQGVATVQLPDYVQSLNTQFRYQLTVIGSFAQAFVAEELVNNQFVIRSSEPNVEISWQITGIRNDVYAQENPLEVVVNKTGIEKGTVLYNAATKTFNPVLNRKAALQQQIETADVE